MENKSSNGWKFFALLFGALLAGVVGLYIYKQQNPDYDPWEEPWENSSSPVDLGLTKDAEPLHMVRVLRRGGWKRDDRKRVALARIRPVLGHVVQGTVLKQGGERVQSVSLRDTARVIGEHSGWRLGASGWYVSVHAGHVREPSGESRLRFVKQDSRVVRLYSDHGGQTVGVWR